MILAVTIFVNRCAYTFLGGEWEGMAYLFARLPGRCRNQEMAIATLLAESACAAKLLKCSKTGISTQVLILCPLLPELQRHPSTISLCRRLCAHHEGSDELHVAKHSLGRLLQ